MIPGKKYTPDDIAAILWRWKWLIVLSRRWSEPWAHTPTRGRCQGPVPFRDARHDDAASACARTSSAAPTRQHSADRIQTITQQIMSRTRLEAIIVDLNLYEEQRRTGLMEDVVERMRRDVSVQTSCAAMRSGSRTCPSRRSPPCGSPNGWPACSSTRTW